MASGIATENVLPRQRAPQFPHLSQNGRGHLQGSQKVKRETGRPDRTPTGPGRPAPRRGSAQPRVRPSPGSQTPRSPRPGRPRRPAVAPDPAAQQVSREWASSSCWWGALPSFVKNTPLKRNGPGRLCTAPPFKEPSATAEADGPQPGGKDSASVAAPEPRTHSLPTQGPGSASRAGPEVGSLHETPMQPESDPRCPS